LTSLAEREVRVKKSPIVLLEVLGFALLLGALGSPLWRLAGNSASRALGAWLLYGVVAIALAGALNRLQRGESMRALGFRYQVGFWADVRTGVVAYAVLYVVSLWFDLAVLSDRANTLAPMIKAMGLSSTAQILAVGSVMALLFGFITGAFHEEIRFRGYYQGTVGRELTPLAGFLAALIPFAFGHYFAHPEWSVGQVLATILPGIVLGLAYYATGSLVVVMTVHTLSNWVSVYPVLTLMATGRRAVALAVAYAWGVAFVGVILVRWRSEIRMFGRATRAMLGGRVRLSLTAGMLIGGALLSVSPLRSPIVQAVAGVCLTSAAVAAKRVLRPQAHT
jgi:membrane protease YdiL (CAAX protease family)